MDQQPRELKNVEIFFDGYSSDFDNIYDDKSNNFIQRQINKYLRYSMLMIPIQHMDKIKNDENSKIYWILVVVLEGTVLNLLN